MIKFHIPGIIKLYNLNEKFINLFNNHKEYFYDGISISGVYGAFVPCLWNGGRIQMSNYIDNDKKIEIINHYNDLGIGVIYTFTNTEIEPRIYADYICNTDITNICNNTKLNKIIIADEGLKQYIANSYSDKNIKFILSTTSDIVIDGTIKDYAKQEKNYDLIVPNYNYNNTDDLFEIKNPSKYEILLNPQCIDNCPHEKEHYKNISLINAGKISPNEEFICPYEANGVFDLADLKKKRAFINVKDLYTKYKDKGFETFKINGRTSNDISALSYYVYYMVKPKYIETVLNEFEEYIIDNYKEDYFNYIKEELLKNE